MAEPLTTEELATRAESAHEIIRSHMSSEHARYLARQILRWHATVKRLEAQLAELEGENHELEGLYDDQRHLTWVQENRIYSAKARADMWRDRSWDSYPAAEDV